MGAWEGDPEHAADRLRAEHGMTFDQGGELEPGLVEARVTAGSEVLLPPWPPKGHDTVPCPTCWLPADLIAPTSIDVLHHSRCVKGHDNALAPAVLEHLRRLSQG